MSRKEKELLNQIPSRVRDVDIYDPLREAIEFDLSDNTSQWPISTKVKSVISEILLGNDSKISRYPDIYANQLKIELAKNIKTSSQNFRAENFIIGCGTDDVIDCSIRALTEQDDLVVVPSPSFPMASIFAKYNGRRVEQILLNEDGSFNCESASLKDAKLVYLCSPNNPTGMSIPGGDIEKLLNETKGFVILDEAYCDFADSNHLDLIGIYPNLIITRTFSKLHSLAGLRIGYAVGGNEIIKSIEAIRGPYKANTVGISAAIASLRDGSYLEGIVKETIEIRSWFVDELNKLGYSPLDSRANFVYIPMASVAGIKEKFESSKMAVRIFEDLDIYGSGIRITLAPKEIMDKVLDKMKSLSIGAQI